MDLFIYTAKNLSKLGRQGAFLGASITGVGVTISFKLLLADSLKMNFSKHFSGIKSQHDISTKDLVIFSI